MIEEPRHTQVDLEESTVVNLTVEDCETVLASDLALREAGRQMDAAEPRAEEVPVASRRLVLVSDARAIVDVVHETQHDKQ